jgi:putative ABC transport system permease protein
MRDLNLSRPARLLRRLRALARRGQTEAAMDAEMRYHIECEIAERVRLGASPESAKREVMRDFGGVERHKEDGRDARGFRALDDAARDASFAVRVLRRNPGFTAAVVATFALGIGCTSAIFSVVNGILLRPLPYARPNELVALWERNAARGADRNVVSVKSFDAWRSATRSLSDMAAMVPAPRTLNGSPVERISAAHVSPSFFRLLGAQPALGRAFEPADELGGGAAVAVLSDAIWRSRYGADSSIIGRTIAMDGESYTVIGVMPATFDPPRYGWMSEQPLWIPFGPTADNRNWGRFLHVIARRAPGVSIEQARAELAAVSERLSRETDGGEGWSSSVVPLAKQITGDVQKPLVVVFAAVLLLLAMAAVNVASLVTAFTRRRAHELAVRRAIGATRLRLLRQQLAQSAVLGALGTVVGLLVGVLATRALVLLMPPDVPRLGDVHVDGRVMAFTTGIALGATLLFGCVAALHGTARDPRGSTFARSGRSTARLGGARIMTVEIAIGLVIAVLAALMVRSLVNLRAVDLGFRAGSVVAGRVSLPSDRYANDERRSAFFDALLARVRSTPGVTTASIATTRPLACCAPATVAYDPGVGADGAKNAPTTDVRFVDESYFSALRVPVLSGKVFTAAESRAGPPFVVVTRALARALWGDRDPIGRTVSMKLFGTTTAQVIGVVADVHLVDARTPVRPALFLSTNRFPSSERDVIVRGSRNANALLTTLRQSLATIDPSIPLYRAAGLDEAVASTLAQDRFTTILLGGFAALALLLAAVGIYGVLAGDVASRRREIGIRLALGARGGMVSALVARRAGGPVLSGVALGLAGAFVLSRAMSALVFGVRTTDPLTFVVVVLVLIGVAAAATLGPAIRAARVSPLDVIRND